MSEIDFARLVLKMLDQQQAYFRAHGDNRTLLLIRAKELEKEVRQEALKIINRQEDLL